jgi:hypothetical protein
LSVLNLLLMNKFLFALFLLFSSVKGYAFLPEKSLPKDSAATKLRKKHPQTIWLNAGQVYRKEIQLIYERELNKWLSAEFGIGYKYPTVNYAVFTSGNTLYGKPYDYAERMPFSKGLYTSAALKIYVGDRTESEPLTGFYISPVVFYRYRFYDHQLVNSQTPLSDYPENWASQQSLDLHIIGLKILLGGAHEIISLDNKGGIKIDYYLGLGCRLKYAKTAFDWKESTSSGSRFIQPDKPTPPSANPVIEKEQILIPSFQAGLKIGFPF